MREQRGKKEISVEDLIRLKRHERPDPVFWQKFHADFERRKLQALVEGDRAVASRWLPYLWKGLAGALPLVVVGWLVAGTLQTSERGAQALALGEVDVERPVEMAAAMALGAETAPIVDVLASRGSTAEFIMDSLHSMEASAARGYTKVQTVPAYESAGGDLQYIRDAYRAQGYGVQSAALRTGTHF